ncbi:transcription termination factor Rho [Corynebacterium cystitidis]|uniref:transcription termination factor Rho n=1 Tax=Corynebacterium cystitidis TaxID=35757 RepID=UPI00211E1BD3|nr:transcription termination factor Rho [Corynebacterium cystitidis]
MTETDNVATQNLAALKLPELRKMAADKGLKSISALRKGELIEAIQTGKVPKRKTATKAAAKKPDETTPAEKKPRRATRPTGAADATQEKGAADVAQEKSDSSGNDNKGEQRYESRSAARRARRYRARHNNDQPDQHDRDRDKDRDSDRDKDEQDEYQDRDNNRDNNRDGGDRRGRRGRRNRRGRNQDNRGGNDNNQQNQELDPAELQEVGGILDIVDHNAAFIRTTGYKASQNDVFVPNNLVRQFGMRSGDAVIGQVRANGQNQSHGHGRNRKRFNKLVRVDSVNGQQPDQVKDRPEFHKLTPLYPNQRLRLETEPNILTTRVIDLVMPIGKGQRALIVSPPKAGKTTILQNMANAISTNNPECYLMVVLVDERPEEVTDMQRSVKGEVIASTFDRPPSEHTAVAELAIERAKRLVEMGQDVVVLLDSITRLGRAYNNSSPASGRILSGGVDSNALYPPKRFLGAARNIEEGGSLTIVATAMVETGSAGDTVIFEEFKGTGNAELKLDRKIAERRVFPAVDVNPSGTRKDELLLVPEEARIMHKLRRILSALDSQAAIDLLIKQLKKTNSNGEFLMQIAQSAPMAADAKPEDYL